MTIIKSIASVFILLLFPIIIGLDVQVQPQPNRLTGTFRLDSSRSENPRDKAQRATQNLRTYERQEVADQILPRLESPEMLTIERHGTTITIASSLAPQSTFEADGRERQEQLPNGRSTKVIATLRGEQLVVSSNGYKEDDFNVTFDATENENSLRVRRQIYSDRLTQPVVVDSVYNRTADVAEWNVYNDSRPVVGNTSATGEFIVRDGESLVAVLNNDLTTKHTAVGAVIGAIAGGGKGAAIGGIIGAAGGAGSVFILGKDNLELPSGTELTIRSSGPR